MSPGPAPDRSDPRLVAARVGAIVALLLALVAGALALGVTAAGGFDCHAYPSCLLEQPPWSVQAHVAAGALLGIAILGLFVLSYLVRRDRPKAFPRAGLSLVVVLVMGGIGAGLSAGTLPELFLLVQTALLFLLLLLLYRTHEGLGGGVRANRAATREVAGAHASGLGGSDSPR